MLSENVYFNATIYNGKDGMHDWKNYHHSLNVALKSNIG